MLLQLYFLHNHWSSQKEYINSVIVDKHIIENLIFAEENLSAELLELYNGIFNNYVEHVRKPDFYIIIQIDWETFKQRIMQRGRQQEIDNFEANKDYFRKLNTTYISKLTALCDKFDIPYSILDTVGLSEQETLSKALEIVKKNILN